MKPILVHIHVFYTELWGELEVCLRNIATYPCEIYVTYVKDDREWETRVRAFPHKITLIKVKNSGYDIAPFLAVLGQVHLHNYSYIAKLHTKRDMPTGSYVQYSNVSGNRWRRYLLSPFATRTALERAVLSMEKDSTIGMVAHHRLFVRSKRRNDSAATSYAMEFCRSRGIAVMCRNFVAGSMFLCRACAMQPLADALRHVTLRFEEADPEHQSTNLAHALERILSWVIFSGGYTLRDTFSSPAERIHSALHYIFHFRTHRRAVIFNFLSIPLPRSRQKRRAMHPDTLSEMNYRTDESICGENGEKIGMKGH